MAVHFVSSQKGKKKLFVYGFLFDKNKISRNGTKIYWECERRRDISCSVRLTTSISGSIVSKNVAEHNHDKAGKHASSLEVRHRLRIDAVKRPEAAPTALVN